MLREVVRDAEGSRDRRGKKRRHGQVKRDLGRILVSLSIVAVTYCPQVVVVDVSAANQGS
jgi:hypothetical protein